MPNNKKYFLVLERKKSRIGLIVFILSLFSVVVPKVVEAKDPLDPSLNALAMDYLSDLKSETVYGDETYNFAVISDTHITSPSDDNPFDGSALEQILEEIESRKNDSNDRISFVIITGDMMHVGDDDEMEEYYNNVASWSISSGGVGGPGQIPVFHVLGNHDVGAAPDLDYVVFDRIVDYIGDPDYYFDFETSRFVVTHNANYIQTSDHLEYCSLDEYYEDTCSIDPMDCYRSWEGSSCQNAYYCKYAILEDQLDNISNWLNVDKQYKFGFTHLHIHSHGAYDCSTPIGTQCYEDASGHVGWSSFEDYRSILVEAGATAHFSGHTHASFSSNYFCDSGAGTYAFNQDNAGEANGAAPGKWVIVRVSPEEVEIEPCTNPECTTLDATAILPSETGTILSTDDAIHFKHQVQFDGVSGYEVVDGQELDITAGSRIRFLPGFNTEPGATLNAWIDCIP